MASHKRGRACIACSSIKIKCALGSDTGLQPPCERCVRLNKECQVTVPKRQRDRVAELESQVAALTKLLQAQGIQEPFKSIGNAEHDGASPLPPAPVAASTSAGNIAKKRRYDDVPNTSSVDFAHDEDGKVPETSILGHSLDPFRIDQLLSRQEQERVLQRYLTEIVPIFPLVPPTGDFSLDSLKAQRPVLFQAVLYAGSTSVLPLQKQEQIARALFNYLSSSAIDKTEKSIELILAIQITCLWYRAPRHHRHIAVYQLIRLAASLAVDIGVAGPLTSPNIGYPVKCADVESGDALRAWLVCHLLCNSMNIFMRRQGDANTEWTKHHDESLLFLEYAPSSPTTDRWLSQFFRADCLCTKIANQMELSNMATYYDVADPVMKHKIQTCRNQILNWRIMIAQGYRIPTILFWEHVATSYMHEPVLHTPTNKQSFAAPFVAENLSMTDVPSPTITQDHITAIYELVPALHSIIDIFVEYNTAELMALPGLMYASRAAYANYLLAKLYIAVTAAGNTLGSIIDPELLRFDGYTSKLVQLSARIHAIDRDCSVARILRASTRMLEWYHSYTASLASVVSTSQPTPLQLSDLTESGPIDWSLQFMESGADYGLDVLFSEPMPFDDGDADMSFPVKEQVFAIA